ncbi:hypothetical protein BU15DRAFT_68418 [Melanogaster broomeanus]|nr:hypothetical protein BU15DRAFT_68418 [Melanogaster broomeanus]
MDVIFVSQLAEGCRHYIASKPHDYLGQIVSGLNAVHSSDLVWEGLLFFSNVREGILSNEVSRQASIRLPRDPPEARQGREDGVPCSGLTRAKQEYDNHQSERTRIRCLPACPPTQGRQDYGIGVDFAVLDDEERGSNDPEALPEFDACIVKLSADIERMAPNLQAIERLDDVEARLIGTERGREGSQGFDGCERSV